MEFSKTNIVFTILIHLYSLFFDRECEEINQNINHEVVKT